MYLPDGSTLPIAHMFGVHGADSIISLNKIDKTGSKICSEMSLTVVEAIHGRYASFMILTATVWEIFGGQTNSYILVL